MGVGIVMLIQGIIGNSLPENERPQSFSNIETDEFSVGTESEGRSDEIQSSAEENSGLSTEQEEQEQNEPAEGSGDVAITLELQ